MTDHCLEKRGSRRWSFGAWLPVTDSCNVKLKVWCHTGAGHQRWVLCSYSQTYAAKTCFYFWYPPGALLHFLPPSHQSQSSSPARLFTLHPHRQPSRSQHAAITTSARSLNSEHDSFTVAWSVFSQFDANLASASHSASLAFCKNEENDCGVDEQ